LGLGNSTTATPAGSPEKQPPASPQDQPTDIIYEDFDMPLASTSGSNDHPDPNSQHEETHTLANPSPWQAVSSEPSTQMEEMDLELDEDLAQILRDHDAESIAIMDRFFESDVDSSLFTCILFKLQQFASRHHAQRRAQRNLNSHMSRWRAHPDV
jgi:hypothetical protein